MLNSAMLLYRLIWAILTKGFDYSELKELFWYEFNIRFLVLIVEVIEKK